MQRRYLVQDRSRQVESSGKGYSLEVRGQTAFEFERGQGVMWFTDLAFGMNPAWFNGIEPGTLLGQ